MLIPYRVEVSIRRWPVANLVILGLLLISFPIEVSQVRQDIQNIVPFVLARGNPIGLVGYIFLHGSLLHLVGNMIFLWVFGNAVCEKVGNIAYPFLFIGLGIVAGATHLLFSDHPAIGASGAINGIVGMFLVWFPTNDLSVFYCWFWWGIGTFRVQSYWMILLWLVFDVLGVAFGLGGAAYWAHLGGFAAGFGLAVFLLKARLVRMEPHERSLLQAFGPEKDFDEEIWPVAPRTAAPTSARTSGSLAMSVAPPEGYFVSFACPCGAELRAPRKRAGEEFTCPKCSARTKIPAE
jgi:membrane associated rhomboid family serine protease/predicted RNA-binding Zn-ribbon protein involved in translation (DUF1610 family)